MHLLKDGERIDVVNDRLNLLQKCDGFSYGTDAVLLASFIRKMPTKNAIEFGAGTGIISLLCEKNDKFKNIYSVEVQEEYYDLLQRNIIYNNSKITPIHSDIRDLMPGTFGFEFDVVFSNPPYMKTTSGKSNIDQGKNCARHEVAGSIDDFCKAASKLLKHGGLFYTVYRPDRAIDLICSMKKYNIEPKRMTMVYPYVDSRVCLMLIEGKKGASSALFNTKPFIIFNSHTEQNNDITDDMQKVYKECDMDDEYKRL